MFCELSKNLVIEYSAPQSFGVEGCDAAMFNNSFTAGNTNSSNKSLFSRRESWLKIKNTI
jgi:hypothetical protein